MSAKTEGEGYGCCKTLFVHERPSLILNGHLTIRKQVSPMQARGGTGAKKSPALCRALSV